MHHVTAETSEDPNTPYGRTWFQMYDVTPNIPGKTGYMSQENMDRYSPEVQPLDDWLERNITGKYWKHGFYLQLLVIGLLFGPIGFILGCIVQTVHRKYFTITVGNILFHNYWFGYKHPGLVKSPDEARNFGPISFFICGEGLHNNHHGIPACPKFSFKWYEVDFGWMWAKIFMALGLLKMTEGAKIALKHMQDKLRNNEIN
jgi:stearoyl-CoA desaturase (delta-9 desaturase)